MSSPSSDGALRLRVNEQLLNFARTNPAMRISATGIGQQLGVPADRVLPLLVQAEQAGLLSHTVLVQCPEGHLGVDEKAAEGEETYCHYCGRVAPTMQYVVFTFTQELIEEAQRQHPKVLRRKAPQMSPLGKVLTRIPPSQRRILKKCFSGS
jgi:hypothetical protein